MQTIYRELTTSKTGSLIPVLQSGKTLESSYNPERDAERKLEAIKTEEKIFLVLGFGSGILIQKLIEKIPDAKILCAEYSKEDIALLSRLPLFTSITEKISLFPKEELYSNLLEQYIPSLYGNLKIIEQTNYIGEIPGFSEYIKSQIEKALKDISKDYSVQAHFGKLWQHNILNNIKQLTKSGLNRGIKQKIDTDKICAVLGAGPTMDEKIPYLKANREKFFIIATDTAFLMSEKQGLHCDAVITLDAQNVSVTHFISKIPDNCLFLVDYSSSPSITNKLKNKTGNLQFFSTGHPLSVFLSDGKLLLLNSGSGTVTIAALDFAIKAVFKEIQVFGADFSYPQNKAYAKGTYLDALYNRNASKIKTSEQNYTHLLYRTELLEKDGVKTTEVLQGYKNSFESFLKSLKISFEKKQNVYVIKNSYENINKESFNNLTFNEKIFEKISSQNQNLKTALLPFAAFLQRTEPELNQEILFEKAESDLRRYLKI